MKVSKKQVAKIAYQNVVKTNQIFKNMQLKKFGKQKEKLEYLT